MMLFAHPGQPIAPHDLWSAWNGSAFLLLALAVTLIVYLLGIRNVWQQAGIGRGVTVLHCLTFIGALLALVVALISPLDAWSSALFSAHMVQHFVLILAAAPLLVLSNFPLVMLWALPRHRAQMLGKGWNQAHSLHRAWHTVSHPVMAWMLFAAMLWLWHLPMLYEAALHDETVHSIEHLSFLLSAMLFWWIILNPSRPKHIRYGVAIPYLFTTALHSGILGALMTFTAQPWYSFYAASVIPWELSALQDQQLGGLIMWLPGSAVLMLLAILYFGLWLGVLEHRTAHSR
jgi:putative membrane protein